MLHILECHPIIKTDFVRAEGVYLYDTAGNRYADFESGKWAAALGHKHPRIQKVMLDQLDKVIHLGARYPSQLAEQAAVKLLDILDMPDGKCVFLSSGSEAVEFGVQTARRLSWKPLMLTFAESYLAAFGSAGKKNPDEWICLNWGKCTSCSKQLECSPECELIQSIPWDQIAGFAYEPGNAAGMVKFPPEQLVQNLTRLTKEHNGLVVVNEITTGMGRTGCWFGFQHAQIKPDVVAVGKGLGNGYPVSAVALSRNVAEELEQNGFMYSQSHQNDPLGCAVAIEVINTMQEDQLVEHSQRLGKIFMDGLTTIAARHPQISEVRGRGLMIVVQFDSVNYPALAKKIYSGLMDRGFISSSSSVYNFVRVTPPLTVSEDVIKQFLDNFDQILTEVNDE